MEKIVISIVFSILGLLVGFLFYKFALHQVKVRCDKMPELAEKYNPKLLSKKWILPVWLILFAGLYALSYNFAGDWVNIVFAIIFSSISVNIIFIDISIRRIPNELLLIALIAKLVSVIADGVIYKEKIIQPLVMAFIGLIVGFVLYIIPHQFGVYIGGGDIKLSAVIGFSLGVLGYLEAMVVMAIIMIVYLVVLLATKKGNLKTYAPMGPALAAGAIFTLFVPMFTVPSISLF